MDVQIVAGLCSKANITVYFSTFDQGGWVDLLNAAITAKPVALSISWGLAEDNPGWSTNAIDAINERLNAARVLGITVCISSGDDGSPMCLDASKLWLTCVCIFPRNGQTIGSDGRSVAFLEVCVTRHGITWRWKCLTSMALCCRTHG